MKKRFGIVVFLIACLVMLCACDKGGAVDERKIVANELTASVQSREVETKDVDDVFVLAYGDFSVKMIQSLYKGDNVCISPLSISVALGMVTNGAVGETKAELESLFGLSANELNAYYAKLMQKSGEAEKLHVANSLWTRQNAVNVENDFLDIVKNYYAAQVYESAFDDQTITDINNWVYKHTRGGIDKIVDTISDEEILILLNALDFDSEWKEKFTPDSVRNRTFNGTDKESTVSMMFNEEHMYFTLDNAQGFAKQYEGGEYKFAAILPDENVSITDFVNGLTGEKLARALTNIQNRSVNIGLPKFDLEQSLDLVGALEKLGVKKAFSGGDFSALGSTPNGGLYLTSVVHKTHITVDEAKTKASAVTEILFGDSGPMQDPTPSVILNRPFVYMILDSANLPLFVGVITNL